MNAVETLREAARLMRKRAEAAQAIADATDAALASWHPAVALAVADWLDLASDHEAGRGQPCGSCQVQALAVARTYLRETS